MNKIKLVETAQEIAEYRELFRNGLWDLQAFSDSRASKGLSDDSIKQDYIEKALYLLKKRSPTTPGLGGIINLLRFKDVY